MSACPGCGLDPCGNASPSFCALSADNRSSGTAPEQKLAALAALSPLAYYGQRKDAAQALGLTVDVLDKLVRSAKTQAVKAEAALPHWQVEPSPEPVDCAALLADIEQVFTRYIVLPRGASVALALWVLHAWTIDADDISPFLVLVSLARAGAANRKDAGTSDPQGEPAFNGVYLLEAEAFAHFEQCMTTPVKPTAANQRGEALLQKLYGNKSE